MRKILLTEMQWTTLFAALRTIKMMKGQNGNCTHIYNIVFGLPGMNEVVEAIQDADINDE